MAAYVEKWTSAAALGSSGHSLNGGNNGVSGLTSSSSSTTNIPSEWSHSTVSKFGVRYVPPIADLSSRHSVEALVEGSEMSTLRDGSPMTPEHAWVHREGRNTRYENKRVGGTVAVHYIKKNMWFLETALALLEGEEVSEVERYEEASPGGLGPDAHIDEDLYWSKWAHNNFGRQRRLRE